MPKIERLRYDGVEAYLALQLDRDATTVELNQPLTHDGGEPVGDISESVDDTYLSLSILDGNYKLLEIVHIIEYTEGSTTLTVDRGMEGTTRVTHPANAKVVHAATVDDFLLVQDHDIDPNAHGDVIRTIAQGIVDTAIEDHVGDVDADPPPNPHPYYAPTKDAVFEGDVTFNSNVTVTVEGILHIVEGAQLIVEGDLIIQNTGRFFINGKEIIVSNTEPATNPDTVWIQTFGGT